MPIGRYTRSSSSRDDRAQNREIQRRQQSAKKKKQEDKRNRLEKKRQEEALLKYYMSINELTKEMPQVFPHFQDELTLHKSIKRNNAWIKHRKWLQ